MVAAITAFLAEHQLSSCSQRVYAGALRILQDHLGAATALAVLEEPRTADQFVCWFHQRYNHTAPATRVRQLVILRSACAFWRRRGWLSTDPTADLERPRVAVDRTKALTREQIAALWRRDDLPLRERALWRLLYETAARANEILSLKIKTSSSPTSAPVSGARAGPPSGCSKWVFWQTGATLLLPRLLAGRTTGPVFLADRQPTRAVPTLDRCPLTGRARLSYRRAAELLSEATPGGRSISCDNSALTHAAENGTNTPMLLARSRHASVRSLERYARPSPEAVARHVAEQDPARRRRWPSRTLPARHRQPRGWPTAASGVRPTLVSYSVVNPLWETGASATGMIDADQRL